MKDRLNQFLEYEKISCYEFEQKILVSRNKIQRYLNGTGEPGVEILSKIGKAYTDLNMDWLVNGRGEMLYYNQVRKNISNAASDEINEELQRQINDLKSTQTEQNEMMRNFFNMMIKLGQTFNDANINDTNDK